MTDASRRSVLKAVGAGSVCLPVVGGGGTRVGRAQTSDVEASVTFDDQESNGLDVTIARASSPVRGFVMIEDADGNLLVSGPESRLNLDAGDVETDATVRLETPIEETQQLTARLQESNGGTLDTDTAEVTVSGEVPERVAGFDPRFVEANPDAGFNYPYYLYAPDTLDDEHPTPMLVQPNNTGTATDDFERHRAAAREDVERGTPRGLADQLGVPLLVPVFPRPRSKPVDWRHYTHQLDRDTMELADGPLERIDLQLLRMVEDAQRRVANEAYPVADDIIMNGFSASGNFVDRFTVLHPDRVLSVTAGGLNGMALLPLSQAKGHSLDYQVGVADVEDTTGEPVDLAALDDVNQLLYMGGQDRNDTLPFGDAWTSDELRATARDVYGDHMLEDRFPYCQSAYDRAGVTAQFRVYDGVGHTPRPAIEDIVEFHRRSIEGESVDAFGQDLGLEAVVEQTPTRPSAGEEVTFDATGTSAGRSEVLAYTWDFGDGETAVGPMVAHSFDDPEQRTATMTAIDSFGRTAGVEIDVGTGETSNSRPTPEPTATPQSSETPAAATDAERTGDQGTDASSASGPGFGTTAALSSLTGTAYLLARRLRSDGAAEDER